VITPSPARLPSLAGGLASAAAPQSDFFALGRTFVYLLTAKEPTEAAIYDAFNDELNWRQYTSGISQELADLIDKMMARLPRERPANAEVILQRLQQINRPINNPNFIGNQTVPRETEPNPPVHQSVPKQTTPISNSTPLPENKTTQNKQKNPFFVFLRRVIAVLLILFGLLILVAWLSSGNIMHGILIALVIIGISWGLGVFLWRL
jgi:serine/threonine protein kinase